MKQNTRSRIDILLVDRGLVSTRNRAKALVMAGKVLVNGAVVDKAGKEVLINAPITLKEGLPFVSRAGIKLEGFLNDFGLDVEGLKVLDAGCSTGGFTDCLLKRGAQHIWAVDVGKGLLDWGLRNDERVTLMEGRNIRYLKADDIAVLVDLAVVDLSFISLKKVLPVIAGFVRHGGAMIVLVKPQFEAGRAEVGKGGIVRDPQVHDRVLASVKESAVSIGLKVVAQATSKIKGAKGNVEFGLYLIND